MYCLGIRTPKSGNLTLKYLEHFFFRHQTKLFYMWFVCLLVLGELVLSLVEMIEQLALLINFKYLYNYQFLKINVAFLSGIAILKYRSDACF